MIGKSVRVNEKNLFEVYENNLKRHPNSVLIEPGKNPVSYDRLNVLIACIYDSIRQLHIAKGTIVSVFIPNGVKRVACMLALLKLGIPFIPLDPLLPKVKIEYIFEKTHPRFVLVGDDLDYRNVWKEYDIHSVDILYLEDILNSANSSHRMNAYLNGVDDSELVVHEDIAIILPTSGSTGIPKLVQLSHGNLLNRIYFYWDDLPYGVNEMACSKTNFVFLDWHTETLSPVLHNQSCLFVQTTDVIDTVKFVEYLNRYNATRLVAVPSLLKSIIEEKREKGLEIPFRHVTCGSDMLPTKLVMDFLETFKGATLSNLLGSTESGGDNLVKTFRSVHDLNLNEEYASVGYPVLNNKVVLWDENYQEINEPYVTGEIVFSGPCVSPGYLGIQPESVEGEDIEKHPAMLLKKYNMCRMNDFAYFSEKDGFMLVGRKDRVLKIRGQKVDLNEVEKAIKTDYPKMDIFVTSQKAPPRNDTKIFAFCAVGENPSIRRKDIILNLRLKLQQYMVPSIIFLPSLPLNPISRKIDRLKLSKMIDAGGGTMKALEPEELRALPRIEKLRLIASYILGVDIEPEEMEYSFMDAGGDSGTIMRFFRELKNYGIKVSVPQIIGKDLKDLGALEDDPIVIRSTSN